LKVSRIPYNNVAFTALKAPWTSITGMAAGFADGVDNDMTYTAGAGPQLSSIASGGVVSAMLEDGVVTGAKLASGAVTTAKIGDA